jgi:hypothetical protein
MTRAELKQLILEELSNIGSQSNQLADEINQAIVGIDESMSYEILAAAVAKVLIKEYGEHNYQPFISELSKHLGV